MNHPLLGDPASMSALGATLRRTALQLLTDGERVDLALEDASPGWSGPTAVRTRRRVALLGSSTREVAAALDDCGRSLQDAATDLAASLARLRELEEEARAAGLEVRDGSVERAWGITGVADAGSEVDGDRLREGLQARVQQSVATLGRQRAGLVTACDRATGLLRRTAALLRS